MMIAVIAITLLMIGCVIVMGIIRNSNRNNPDVKPPEQTTDTTDTIPDQTIPDQTIPEIPPITDSGTETDKSEDSSHADITIDVVRPKDAPHDDTPGVVGDVVIMPGIKEGER